MQVGQLLTNLRVSSNNLLLPFTAQILQLLQDDAPAKPASCAPPGTPHPLCYPLPGTAIQRSALDYCKW